MLLTCMMLYVVLIDMNICDAYIHIFELIFDISSYLFMLAFEQKRIVKLLTDMADQL